jgi:hypothetical protein
MTEVQQSFHPSTFERLVTSAADIQACLVIGSNQPLCRALHKGCYAQLSVINSFGIRTGTSPS